MRVFISYRRDDSHYIADRIYELLAKEFGIDNVFKDVDSIPIGVDFRQVIHDAVGQCDVLLAVIGNQWLTLEGSPGKRRIDDPADYVRIEIEAALQRQIPLVPVLVLKATMPREEDLPHGLKELTSRNGLLVRPDPDYRNDLNRLIDGLRKLKSRSPSGRGRRKRTVVPRPIILLSLFATVLTIAIPLISLSPAVFKLWQGHTPEDGGNESMSQSPHVAAPGSAKLKNFEPFNSPQSSIRHDDNQAKGIVLPYSPSKTVLPLSEGYAWSITFNPRNQTLTAGYRENDEGGVISWETTTHKRTWDQLLRVNKVTIRSLAYSPDGHILAAACDGGIDSGVVVLWDVATRQELGQFSVDGFVSDVTFNPDGKTFAAGSFIGARGGVVLWDAATRQRLGEPLTVSEGQVTGVAFSPDGNSIAASYGNSDSGGVVGGIVIWDAATRKRLGEPLSVSEGYINNIVYSPDGGSLATGYGGRDRSGVVLWDAATRQRLGEDTLFAKGEGIMRKAIFTPDGNAIVVGYSVSNEGIGRGGVMLWDVGTRRRLNGQTLSVEGFVEDLAFSPDGKSLAVSFGTITHGRPSGPGGVVLWGTQVQPIE